MLGLLFVVRRLVDKQGVDFVVLLRHLPNRAVRLNIKERNHQSERGLKVKVGEQKENMGDSPSDNAGNVLKFGCFLEFGQGVQYLRPYVSYSSLI